MTRSTRKIQRSTWKNGVRRSPRLCALDAWKAQKSKRVMVTDSVERNSQSSEQEEELEQEELESSISMGPPSRSRRGRKARKLRPVQQVLVGRENPKHENHSTSRDDPLVGQATDSKKNEDGAIMCSFQPSTVSSSPWMPEKRTLELVIDILQRRDTHEIFAEPVDPDEVEDYYEIIEEPMDFGTMRAKLHEGMYKSLEQFERDVFLISRNAMHFNSSGTIYFRQARAIHELAKKVFHVLKTEPENLELEFSVSRRQPGRRLCSEARVSNYCSRAKRGTNTRGSIMNTDLSSKSKPSAFSTLSNIRRNVRTPGASGRAISVNTCNHESLSGARDDGSSSSFKEDRRSTYTSWMEFFKENNSIFSSVQNNPKTLMHVNQLSIGYRESLMLFVKELGPTAQKIAKRKVQEMLAGPSDQQTPCSNCWIQAPKSQDPALSSSTQLRLVTSNTMISQNFLDHHHFGYPSVLGSSSGGSSSHDADKGEKPCAGDGTYAFHASAVIPSHSDGKNANFVFGGEAHTRNGMNDLGLFRRDKVYQTQTAQIQLDSNSPTAGLGGLEFLDLGNKNTDDKFRKKMDLNRLDTHVQPSELASDYSQSSLFNFMGRDKNNSWGSSLPLKSKGVSGMEQAEGVMHDSCSKSPLRLSDGGSSSSQKGQALEMKQPMPLVSQFIFDLPYLKLRLNQMNYLGEDGFSNSKEPLFETPTNARVSTKRVKPSARVLPNHEQILSLDTHHTNLAFQL